MHSDMRPEYHEAHMDHYFVFDPCVTWDLWRCLAQLTEAKAPRSQIEIVRLSAFVKVLALQPQS